MWNFSSEKIKFSHLPLVFKEFLQITNVTKRNKIN